MNVVVLSDIFVIHSTFSMAPNTTDTSSSTDSSMVKGNEVSDVKIHNTSEVVPQESVGCCKKLSDAIIGAFERFFYRLVQVSVTIGWYKCCAVFDKF